MDVRQLEMFRAVAEEGTFTRAAERLHVSQSAVSRQLQLLEEELRTLLFHRTGRGVMLTDSGHLLLTTANRINRDMQDVVSQISQTEQLQRGMQSVAQQLDTGIGLKLMTPGFKTWPHEKDPFSGYGPGCGENGAIFCHANTWAIIAEALLGHGEQAWKYFTQMMPQNVIDKVGLDRYSAEPYAWVSNIVGPENPRFGWGNVSQVTGTAAWMDLAGTAYLLGVRTELDGVRIAPCIPSAWEGFTVKRRYRGTTVNLTVENPRHVSAGVSRLILDGKELPIEGGAVLPFNTLRGRAQVQVKAILG
jgi:cellobiose phosphorylase